MARRSRHPIIIEDQLKIALSDLKRYGWMNGVAQPRTLTWNRYGKIYASVSITILLDEEEGHLDLKYSYDGQLRSQVVELELAKSNLGRGMFWYMICPVTGCRCRALLDGGGLFVSRNALDGALYRSQAISKNARALNTFWDKSTRYKQAVANLFNPYQKSHYRGRPTPRTRRFLKLKSTMENGSPENVAAMVRAGLG